MATEKTETQIAAAELARLAERASREADNHAAAAAAWQAVAKVAEAIAKPTMVTIRTDGQPMTQADLASPARRGRHG